MGERAGTIPCVLRGAARGGWVEVEGQRRVLAAAASSESRALAAENLRLEAFPGRWNPRRALPPELEPLPAVAAAALEEARWWQPGSGEVCRGGLVVGCDGGPLVAALGFARALRDATSSSSSSSSSAAAKLGPSGFLYSLPSTAAGVLGILFGLTEYQATVVGGALAGIRALHHALDLIDGGRLDRVLVAVLSVVEADLAAPESGAESVRLGVALALEAARQEPRHPKSDDRGFLCIDCGFGRGEERGDSFESLPAPCRRLGAAPLFLLAGEPERAAGFLVHADPFTGERGWVSMERKGSFNASK